MAIVKSKNKKTGITYVYESESYWDPEKKQPRNHRKLIGKLDEDGNVVWDRTPEPQTGTDIGKDVARSVADRYLGAKYPRFSQLSFSRVACRHATDPTEAAEFQVPYYQFDYFVNDGSGDSAAEQLAFSCIVNAYTKEIEYSCAASLDEGNG